MGCLDTAVQVSADGMSVAVKVVADQQGTFAGNVDPTRYTTAVLASGELTNRLSSDTQVIQNACTVNLSGLARYLSQIVGSIAIMFVVNWKLTMVLLSVVPAVSIGAGLSRCEVPPPPPGIKLAGGKAAAAEAEASTAVTVGGACEEEQQWRGELS